ncbi:MAG: glucokinase [Betaproteobacteria bacterium]
MKTVLAADIGATNARFALVERPSGDARIVFERTYPTASFPDFEPALAAFLDETEGKKVARAAIAIAGPVDGDTGRLTNRSGWTVDRHALERLGVEARLINDFHALAHGVAHAEPGDYTTLQAGKSAPRASIALVGAGTGLGVACLVWDGRRYRPAPSEGGHAGFAPRDDTQVELWRHLRARHGRVSAERVLCGAGLAAIYEFISGSQRDPAEISSQAQAEPSGAAGKALDLFVDCYGAFAGDVALAFLARGGVYVCGGIAAKLARRLGQGDFLAAFNDKGRHRELLASIPVRVVINEKLGLLGAARAAASTA